MRKSSLPTLCLSAIAAAVLATGCCPDDDDLESYDLDLEGELDEETFEELVLIEQTNPARCEDACRELAHREGLMIDEIFECEATGDVLPEQPWDLANESVTVACTGHYEEPGSFCTGRRPQGHLEVQADVRAHEGRWLAVHAHLERASVRAFDELADWLARRGAPDDLVVRCRAAARDEIVHADLMDALAREADADVPACEADPPAEDALAVALHNAVEGCVHEVFAAIVARRQATAAVRPELRDVFARIADDELTHGQLAWDVHRFLLGLLCEVDRRAVERAQTDALARLPEVIAKNARATPRGLGWPPPSRAAKMAEHFATIVRAQAC